VKAFVIFRDRVSYAKQCVEALQMAGLEVHIIDQDSTYPPAVEWLEQAPAQVHKLVNQHPQRLWQWTGLSYLVGMNQHYVVTDCDVVPGNPGLDWVGDFQYILDRYPDRCKVGWSLRLSDIPKTYKHRQKVIDWENQHWQHPLDEMTPGRTVLFGAAVDTTLAMYQPLNMYPSFLLGPALRAGYPYYAKHLSWYEDSTIMSAEQAYYETMMNRDFSHWIAPERYA
jgi:hypothetical protein